jgi:hypothetical protein
LIEANKQITIAGGYRHGWRSEKRCTCECNEGGFNHVLHNEYCFVVCFTPRKGVVVMQCLSK